MQKLILLIILFCFQNRLFSQNESKLESIYIPAAGVQNISSGIVSEIQSTVKIQILNISKGKYTVIDDEIGKHLKKQLAEQQLFGLEESKQIEEIHKILSPDYIIFIHIFGGEEKLNLTLKLVKKNINSYNLINEVILDFYPSQAGFYVVEGINKLFNKNYDIDDIKAPPTTDTKFNFTQIDSEQIKEGKLKTLKSSSKDKEVVNILKILKTQEKTAVQFFKEKNYKQAFQEYVSIIETIKDKVRDEKKDKITDYLMSLENNLKFAYLHYIQEELEITDTSFKEELTNYNIYKNYKKQYSELLKEYHIYSKFLELNDVEKNIKDRITYMDISSMKLKEKEADHFFYKQNFEDALSKYYKIQKQLKQKDSDYLEYKKTIDEKIRTTKKIGTNNLMNQVRAYCDHAENINLKAHLMKKSGKKNQDEIDKLYQEARESLSNAKQSIEKNKTFTNKEIQDYYNTSFSTINRGEGKKLGEKIKTKEEKNLDTANFYKKFDYILPGLGQGLYGNYYGFLKTGIFLFSLYGIANSKKEYDSYRKEYDQTNLAFAYLALTNPNEGLYISSGAQGTLGSIQENGENSSFNYSYFSLLAVGVYFLNMVTLDQQFTTGSSQKSGFNLNFYREPALFQPNAGSNHYSISYTFSF